MYDLTTIQLANIAASVPFVGNMTPAQATGSLAIQSAAKLARGFAEHWDTSPKRAIDYMSGAISNRERLPVTKDHK